MASSTCYPKASVYPAGLTSEKEKKKTGAAGSKKKSGGQSGRSGEQDSSVVLARSIYSTQCNNVASTGYDMVIYAPNKLMIALGTEATCKQKSCDQSGKSASSGGDNSGDQKEYGAVMTGTSCSSSTTKPANKRKREVTKKSLAYLYSAGTCRTCARNSASFLEIEFTSVDLGTCKNYYGVLA